MSTATHTTKHTQEPIIDKEVFDTFFHESYCPLEYAHVKSDFEEIASNPAELFTDDCDRSRLTRKNFVLYLTSDAYCAFEAVVEETFESLNPEIVDAVMDLSATVDHADEITEKYWTVCEELLKNFLGQLYDEKLGNERK